MKTLKYIIPVAIIIAAIAISQTGPKEKLDPSSMGTINGQSFQTREEGVRPPTMDTELVLESVQAATLSPATKIGNAGDIILIIKGKGFVATSLNPVVVIGENTFEETIISQDFRQLYAIIPIETWQSLKKSNFRIVEVRNPGRGSARLTVDSRKIEDANLQSPQRALVYITDGIQLE